MAWNPINRYLLLDKHGRWVLNFGKYSEEFLLDIVEVDPEYIEWFLDQDIPQPVREIIEESVARG